MTTLQYYMHDEPDAFRLELSGGLEAAAAQDVYHAWRTALSIIGARPFIVDFTYVSGADEYGRALLRFWRGHRVRIVARSVGSRQLVESILGERLPDPPVKPGLIQRLSRLFRRRRHTTAEPPAGAGHALESSAPQTAPSADFTALFEPNPLARRLR
jgi:hypothetical protein